jgi:hypothetical protein
MVVMMKLAQADLLEQVVMEQFLLPTVVAGGRCSDHLDLQSTKCLKLRTHEKLQAYVAEIDK